MTEAPTEGARPAPGRNEPCPCQSGRKYKQCCLAKDAEAALRAREQARAEASAAAAEAAATDAPPPKDKHPSHPSHRMVSGGGGVNARGYAKAVGAPRKVGGG